VKFSRLRLCMQTVSLSRKFKQGKAKDFRRVSTNMVGFQLPPQRVQPKP
jgi:hypothetical protein